MVLSTNFEIMNRTINIPPLLTDIIVEGDTNSKRITFTISRFFDSVDLSTKQIKINYINSNGESSSDGAYLNTIDIESFTFTWIMQSGIASASGDVKISVEFYDEYGYRWKTKPKSFTVEESFTVLNNVTPIDYTALETFYSTYNDNGVTAISDTNEPIYIQGRRILMPMLEDFVVSGDSRSQVISFVMDRFNENVDFSTRKIVIPFVNAKNESDYASIVNKIVIDNTITFGWLIDSKVTEKDGIVNFCIEVIGYDEESKFSCWKTLPAQFTVEKGIDVSGNIPEPDPSWIQSWEIEKERFIKSLPDNFNLAESYLQSDIKGTTQRYIFDEEEQPIKIQHVLPDETVIREDIFIYSENLITEVRTLNTGETLTFIYHLDTFETEVV